MARFGTELRSRLVRTADTFLRVDKNEMALRQWVPWVAHFRGRLMCLMPDAVPPPLEYLTELSLSYLRTAADLGDVQTADAQHQDAMNAAVYSNGKAADTNA